MGEATSPPEENGNPEIAFENEHDALDEDMMDREDDMDELTQEEVEALDNKLDALNLALDAMETKREEIHSQLMDLLEVSKAMRMEMSKNQKPEKPDSGLDKSINSLSIDKQ